MFFQSTIRQKIGFVVISCSIVLYVYVIWLSLFRYQYSFFTLYWYGAMLLLFLLYRSLSPFLDAVILLVSLWFAIDYQWGGLQSLYLSLTALLLISFSHRCSSKVVSFSGFLLLFFWAFTASDVTRFYSSFFALFIGMTVVLSCIGHAVEIFRKPLNGEIQSVDFIICSYSGNTAHFCESFIHGLKSAGMSVRIHRFHYHNDFTANLSGDALVVAFPVIGWKPPWSFNHYLRKGLPKGEGKAAFILYTCAGGPENSFLLPWLWLTLKGYRLRGHLWCSYPVNVPTFRLGPKRMWRFFDKLLPMKLDLVRAFDAGKRFSRNEVGGFPFFIYPLFLCPIGVLLDNRWLDRILYRNHVWKSRCNSCGLCVTHCPQQRLTLVNGIPKAKGTCTICMGCVNICPSRAMEMTGFTEYGQQYRPRWPKLLVTNRKRLKRLESKE